MTRNTQKSRRFQSSLPRGERPPPTRLFRYCCAISILAPTRGATAKEIQDLSGELFQSSLPRGERRSIITQASTSAAFQSSLPRGERHSGRLTTSRKSKFQSSLPRGERRSSSGYLCAGQHFNPRSHEGSDPELPESL